ncbi:MAG: exo-alpha-sialidase [Chloroflexi bacterium]|nr:exo-alpha-sialidase [Chloroflexota bacterium]
MPTETVQIDNTSAPQITLGDPVLVSQAPPEIRNWGPWQFPHVERLADGRLHLVYHIAADSAKAYGQPVGHALSTDNGQSWQLASAEEGQGGLLLPNGDRLKAVTLPSRKVEELNLPEPIHFEHGTYKVTYTYYPAEKIPPELGGWRLKRLPAGATAWREEHPPVNIPGAVRYATEGVFVFPWFYQERMKVVPDGSIWLAEYLKHRIDGKVQAKIPASFLRSTDNGYSWYLHSEIPYQPDARFDPQAEQREGFTEPEFNFMPDGSIFCLLRTTDGLGVGPMYWSRSTDNGQTWSAPQYFDNNGVWPQLLTLENGVTLTSYGRPGLYLRASDDPAGLTWGSRVTVVPPGVQGKDTCSYTDIIPLDAHTALLAYSDFNYPDTQGTPCKSIMVRTVRVT